MRYAFTGPSRLTAADEDRAAQIVAVLADPTEITTGAAEGWDTEVALAALAIWPEALHRIVTPGAAFNLEGVNSALDLARRLHRHFEVITLPEPERGGAPVAYRERNRLMVHGHCDVLVAAVRSPEPEDPSTYVQPRFYRSGEWMTVNIARKVPLPVQFVRLGPA